MQFSFKKGIPVAQIFEKGPNNGKIIFIDDKKEEKFDKTDPILLLGAEFFDKQKIDNKKLKVDDLHELCLAIKANTTPKNPKLLTIFKNAMQIFEEKKSTEIKLEVGHILPVPNPEGRQCLYIAAPSGAGKSTYVSFYAAQWQKMFPNNLIYVFSALDDDKVLDDLKPIRIPINSDLTQAGLESKDFKNSLVIFDDIDVIADKKVKDTVFKIQDQMLQIGRHSNVYVVTTSHVLSNYSKTKIVLGEAHQITVFPNGNLTDNFKKFLERHCGFSKVNIKRIEGLKSRWVTINKNFPCFVMYETGIFLC